MHIAQRVVVVIAVVMFLLAGITLIQEKEEKFQNQWESVHTECFLEKICRTECISWEEYRYYKTILNYIGTDSDICINIYQKEWDAEENVYYYLISWEEVQQCLWEENHFACKTESIIEIVINRQCRKRRFRNKYYGIVSGKE